MTTEQRITCNNTVCALRELLQASKACRLCVIRTHEWKDAILTGAREQPQVMQPILNDALRASAEAKAQERAAKQARREATVAKNKAKRNEMLPCPFTKRKAAAIEGIERPQIVKHTRVSNIMSTEKTEKETPKNLTEQHQSLKEKEEALLIGYESSDSLEPADCGFNEASSPRNHHPEYSANASFDHNVKAQNMEDDNESDNGEGHPPSGYTDNPCSQFILVRHLTEAQHVELGLLRNDPTIVAVTSTAWRKLHNAPAQQMPLDKVFQLCRALMSQRKGSAVLTYLSERVALLKYSRPNPNMPATWTMSNLIDIVEALDHIEADEDDLKLHKAFAQIKLHDAVKEDGSLIGKTAELKYPLSKQKARRAGERYERACRAGVRWKKVVEAFGGPGVVIVFFTAGIPTFHITSKFTEFELQFLMSLAGKLPAIKKVVDILGPDALEDYCRRGNLSAEVIQDLAALQTSDLGDEE
ncbi:uncharacterized protein KY384_004672 [Bacidia gigantensis]|uniref:uncharacterized protein n=1 Tax=Bacidia gigantensis TaxID=2732470 RepID=UPI001D04B917|nr:uncharacterized protein KY384_004672 [Bacidia gigantensis]KAG8530634.1 hypothetical protein KY384_004672 [Bacidia gigantensis]